MNEKYFMFTKSKGRYRPCANCLIYIKSGNVVKKSGKNQQNINKIGKNRNFHMLSIDTVSSSANLCPLLACLICSP